MLLELNIKDFAIIDNLHLSLHRLFNVFTGETGAGKSIIIDAVSALLGGRIGADFVRAGCERASVEGIFSTGPLPSIHTDWAPFEASLHANGGNGVHHDSQSLIASSADAESADAGVALASLLHEYDITPEDGQLILSRDIFRSGRTVARINGRAYSQQILQQVASWLVDIHGQSEHMSLLRPEQHVNFLDRYAELLPLRAQLATKVTEWRNARKTLQEMQKNESDIEDNPRRLGEIEERLDLISKLKRKYGSTIEEILKRAAEDQAELESIINRDEIIARLQQQDNQFRQEIGLIAQQLSTRRS